MTSDREGPGCGEVRSSAETLQGCRQSAFLFLKIGGPELIKGDRNENSGCRLVGRWDSSLMEKGPRGLSRTMEILF